MPNPPKDENSPAAPAVESQKVSISPGELLMKISRPIVREDPGPDVDYSDDEDEGMCSHEASDDLYNEKGERIDLAEAAAQKVDRQVTSGQVQLDKYTQQEAERLAGSTRPEMPPCSDCEWHGCAGRGNCGCTCHNMERAASVQQEPLSAAKIAERIFFRILVDGGEAAKIAERIFFRILVDGGEGNPFASMKSEWFIEQATPVIEASLDLRPAAPRTQAEPQMDAADFIWNGYDWDASGRGYVNKQSGKLELISEVMDKFAQYKLGAPRTQGREEKIFKGWIAFGCGKHPRNSQGGTRYDIDCLDCQKQSMVAWFEGDQPISPLAQARTQSAPKCPKCGSGELYMRHIEPHIGYSAVQCPVCLPSGSFILKTPTDFAQFFTALPEATKKEE